MVDDSWPRVLPLHKHAWCEENTKMHATGTDSEGVNRNELLEHSDKHSGSMIILDPLNSYYL
jgi:hypothetical protein